MLLYNKNFIPERHSVLVNIPKPSARGDHLQERWKSDRLDSAGAQNNTHLGYKLSVLHKMQVLHKY